MGCNVKNKSSVLCKPFDVSFISCVQEDWSILLRPAPIFVVDQVSLLKCFVALGSESVVIEHLSEEVFMVELIWGRKRDLLCLND